MMKNTLFLTEFPIGVLLLFCRSANAVMAFSNYHEKFRQIGTDPNSYESWVDSKALIWGLERLRNLMNSISPSSNLGTENIKCSFEQELSTDFAEKDYIKEQNNGRTVVGVAGVCDWVNKRPVACANGENVDLLRDVDLLEIKFVHHLSNIHRLQVLVYTAIYALKVNNIKANNGDVDDEQSSSFDADDYEWEIECCRGMLYNARTGEMEICTIQSRKAMDFLLDISQFKYNGKDRKHLLKEEKDIVSKSQIKREGSCTVPNDGVSLSRRPRLPKKRLRKNTGKSYYTPLCVDDNDEICSKKPKDESLRATHGDGTDHDPIILD